MRKYHYENDYYFIDDDWFDDDIDEFNEDENRYYNFNAYRDKIYQENIRKKESIHKNKFSSFTNEFL